MPFRTIALTVLALFVAAAGWRYRNADWVRSWVNTTMPAKAKPIVFDNGTVRAPPVRASGAAAAAAATGLRKCIRGQSVSYTDQPCPPGSREAEVTRGAVTVVEGPAPAIKPAAGLKLPNARDAMRPEGPTLNEQAIERATR
jgi:hypothetical protein